jgi:hypothetical protein
MLRCLTGVADREYGLHRLGALQKVAQRAGAEEFDASLRNLSNFLRNVCIRTTGGTMGIVRMTTMGFHFDRQMDEKSEVL